MSNSGGKPSWNVLVVDDDAGMRRVVARAVRSSGHAAIEADNGVSALRALDAGSVDLVITDVVMPDMEGLELLRRIRKRPQAPKVIVVSGGGQAMEGHYLELARSFGAQGTMTKPLAMADLLAMMDEVMMD